MSASSNALQRGCPPTLRFSICISDEQEYCYDNGWNCPGNNIETHYMTRPKYCMQNCDKMAGCVGIWYWPKYTCSFKTKICDKKDRHTTLVGSFVCEYPLLERYYIHPQCSHKVEHFVFCSISVILHKNCKE